MPTHDNIAIIGCVRPTPPNVLRWQETTIQRVDMREIDENAASPRH